MLSFAREGATLALDFANRGAPTLALLGRLDDIVRQAGGRLYPAKDGRMPADMFRSGYPEWSSFATHVDPRFSSNFWRRVVGVTRQPAAKRVIVLGALSAMAEATARLYAAEGARLILARSQCRAAAAGRRRSRGARRGRAQDRGLSTSRPAPIRAGELERMAAASRRDRSTRSSCSLACSATRRWPNAILPRLPGSST